MTIWNLVVKLRPTSSFLTPSLAIAMSGDDSEPKAACRDGLNSPRVGFRAGLTNMFQRCIERIFSSQAPSTPPHRAGSTLSHPKTPSRTFSLIEEENYVAKQVREIYCKLLTTSLPCSSNPAMISVSSSNHSDTIPWPISYPSRSQ